MAGGERRPLCENKIQMKTEETSRHEKGKNGSGRAAHDCDLGTHTHARTRERVGEEKEVYASAARQPGHTATAGSGTGDPMSHAKPLCLNTHIIYYSPIKGSTMPHVIQAQKANSLRILPPSANVRNFSSPWPHNFKARY